MTPTRVAALVAALICGSALPQQGMAGDHGWTITLPGRGVSHDTRTGITSSRQTDRQGLAFSSRKRDLTATGFWDAGHHRASIKLGDRIIVDGTDDDDIARVGGFRFQADGTYVYLRTTKGPDATTQLILSGDLLHEWPRGVPVMVLDFTGEEILVAVADGASGSADIFRISVSDIGKPAIPQSVGRLEGCALITARRRGNRLYLEVACQPGDGSDIRVLDLEKGDFRTLESGPSDQMFVPARPEKGFDIRIASVEGSETALQAYHAIAGSLLTQLGEPRSLASDAAGTQSWGVSYRVRALAELAAKTGHPVFADLAVSAMRNTLNQSNAALGVDGPYNPVCGWASRIYSKDGLTPTSLLVNQAMIVGSMQTACARLGPACPNRLRDRIERQALCLADHFEPSFDEASGLYRIQYGAPFRFDGIWAPWNWQLSFAAVLARLESRPDLVRRSKRITGQFLETWHETAEGALWRYWPEQFFLGWKADDDVSVHMPAKKSAPAQRYEDVNHAGISLLALSDMGHAIEPAWSAAAGRTLDRLLGMGYRVTRHLDGSGPRTPSWLPAAGWHEFATRDLNRVYAGKVPGATSGARHLAYALLFDETAPFHLAITYKDCRLDGCVVADRRTYSSVTSFLQDNDLFLIEPTRRARLSRD